MGAQTPAEATPPVPTWATLPTLIQVDQTTLLLTMPPALSPETAPPKSVPNRRSQSMPPCSHRSTLRLRKLRERKPLSSTLPSLTVSLETLRRVMIRSPISATLWPSLVLRSPMSFSPRSLRNSETRPLHSWPPTPKCTRTLPRLPTSTTSKNLPSLTLNQMLNQKVRPTPTVSLLLSPLPRAALPAVPTL